MSETKRCTMCKNDLSIDLFNKKKGTYDGLQAKCKTCSSEHSRKYYQSNKEKLKAQIVENNNRYRSALYELVNKLKASIGCALCPENESCCLDLHHFNSQDKEFEISSAIRHKTSWSVIKEEIEKCVCICSNCHRKLHAGIKSVNESHMIHVPDEIKPSWSPRASGRRKPPVAQLEAASAS